MSFKISNIVDYNQFIALDIGTSKIKVLICSIEGAELKILGSAIMRQSKKNIIDGEIANLYGVSETIKKAISKAGENLDEIPNDMVISLGSTLTFSDIIRMNYIRENPEELITMDEIDHIVKKVEHTSLDRVKGKIRERTGIIESEMKLVTTSLISITVDGKKLGNPIGFTGKNIRLGIINIFVPVSYVSMIQNIGRGLSKNVISLIPSIVTLPKLLEEKNENFDFNACIDFGSSKTTIVIENKGEILGGNTLNFGFGLLEETFKQKAPNLGYLDIEHHITHIEETYEEYKEIFDIFLGILFDALFVAMTDITSQLFLKNIFISGGGFSPFLQKKLEEYLKTKNIGNSIHVEPVVINIENISPHDTGSFTQVLALAKATEEMLLLKKDPIARILRYIIYRYE
ncbi:hypothetical protein AUK10_03540 [Candidatus Gracilibacteria bacterium CG2_30_37_12]|nr:MAG: hypothetical protein AUK10_03540 [Candidatus Gracilibacteria bacterium CG2_30_37_12]